MARAPKRRIGLIGFGFIGRQVYRRMAADIGGPLEIAFVHNRSPDALAEVPEALRLHDLADIATRRPDLVVEMAHPDYSRRWGEAILRHASLLPLSVTALADDNLRTRMEAQARAAGTTLAIPHGALMGLDSLREWRHAWEEVTITFVKHPSNIDFSAAGGEPAGVQAGDVLYDGSARGIAHLFPRNVNTMVTCALATVGLDRCRARLVAGATPGLAVAEVTARGSDGSRLEMRKEQPAQGVSGTEMFESQYASLVRAAGLLEPVAFV
ncbi:aspartate dehydrogenase domain-containing protein [Ramlibacter sp. AN1015]|uniref:aspartate dehydrogenase domain-containing protein n=1 Tax=Ramlibacter sp. AN1015 TaxID=3133428 RepID=UPI0030C48BDC